MLKIRSRISLRRRESNALLIEWNIIGRLLNFSAFILLLTVVIYALAIAGERFSLFGGFLTLFFGLIFFCKAAMNTQYLFSIQRGTLTITRSLAGIPLTRQRIRLETITAVSLSAIEYDVQKRETSGLYYLKLSLSGLETAHISIDESTDSHELRAYGVTLSSYLGIHFDE